MAQDDSTLQLFQPAPGQPTVAIQSILDPKTNLRFVLWKHITKTFPGVIHVRHGSTAVQYMMDEEYEDIVPLRIQHVPSVVLNVVFDRQDSSPQLPQQSPTPQHTSSASSMVSPTLSIHELHPETGGSAAPLVQIMTPTTTNQAEMAFQQYSETFNSYSLSLSSGQGTLEKSQLASMQGYYNNLQVEIAKTQDLARKGVENQHDMMDMQKRMMGLQQEAAMMRERMMTMQSDAAVKQLAMLEMQEESARTQERILELQKEALDRIVMVQNRVQALITQTYELHEYPIPRLFIVLPKEPEMWDMLQPFTHKFRLYFLCECGEHTQTPNSKIPHKIHLAKHEGYDLERPTEFFEQYGPYLLTMMEMVKFGVAAAGVVAPIISNLKVLDGIDAFQESMSFTKETFGPLVEQTIGYVAGQIGAAADTGGYDGKEGEALEGADLRQLATFLGNADQGKVLGNLYRIVTTDGHVKWVCLDHYRENYKESATAQLQEMVHVNSGIFAENEGRIGVELHSKMTARQFYETLVKARGIRQVYIWLRWDATKADLLELQDAIQRSNVVIAKIDCSAFDSPKMDFASRGSRFNPLLRIAGNGMVRSFQVTNCPKFLDRISDIVLPNTALRSMDLGLFSHEETGSPAAPLAQENLLKVLRQQPHLVDLTIAHPLMAGLFSTLATKIVLACPTLEHLVLKDHQTNESVSYEFDQRKPIIVSITYAGALPPPLLFTGGKLRSVIFMTALKDLTILQKILAKNLDLSEFSLISSAQDLLQLKVFDELTKGRRGPLKFNLLRKPLEKAHTIFQLEDESSSKARQTPKTPAADGSTPVEVVKRVGYMVPGLYCLLHQARWQMSTLDTGAAQFNDQAAMILDAMTGQQDLDITTLILDLSNLGPEGMKSVERIASRLVLEKLVIKCAPVPEKLIKTGADGSKRWFTFKESSLTELKYLNFEGEQVDEWIQALGSVYLKREALPKLIVANAIGAYPAPKLSLASAQYLALLTQPAPVSSAVTKVETKGALALERSKDGEDPSSSGTVSAAPAEPVTLQKISIECLHLENPSWEAFLDALDLSTLLTLNLRSSNFGQPQFDRLLELIPEPGTLTTCSLSALDLTMLAWLTEMNPDDKVDMLSRVSDKVPGCSILK